MSMVWQEMNGVERQGSEVHSMVMWCRKCVDANGAVVSGMAGGAQQNKAVPGGARPGAAWLGGAGKERKSSTRKGAVSPVRITAKGYAVEVLF